MGGYSQKGSSVTKYSIRIHHEQFIEVALEQHYGCIRGKTTSTMGEYYCVLRFQTLCPSFDNNHSNLKSLLTNRFNYILAIGSNHTILDKSLLGVNNTLILYKLS